MKIRKKDTSFIILLVLFLLAFYVKYEPQELRLVHGFPTTTDSSDAVFHAIGTEWIAQDEIHYRMAPYEAIGKTDVYHAVPPQLYIGAAFFTKFGGMEAYDSIFLFAVIMFAASLMVTYLLLSRLFGQVTALFASFLIILPLETAFFYVINIGWYHQLAAVVFFPVVTYLVLIALEKNRFADYVLISLCICASVAAHIVEGAVLLLFLVFVMFLKALEDREVSWKMFRNYSVFILPALVLYHQLWVTKIAGISVGGLFTGRIPVPFSPGIPVVSYNTLHWSTMFFGALGVLCMLLMWKKREIRYLGLWFLVFFMGFFANWAGIPFWPERIRFTSYLLLYPLAGIGVFFLAKFVDKKYRPFLWIFAFLLVFSFGFNINRAQIYGEHPHLLDQERYDALLWLKDETPEDATVFFFDGYWQGTGEYSRRLGTDLGPQHIQKLAEPGLIEVWERSTWGYHQSLPYKTGLFSFGNYEDISSINLCEMDYKIFVNYQQLMPALEKYQNKLLETNEAVYDKNGILILKDTDGKAGCLA